MKVDPRTLRRPYEWDERTGDLPERLYAFADSDVGFKMENIDHLLLHRNTAGRERCNTWQRGTCIAGWFWVVVRRRPGSSPLAD